MPSKRIQDNPRPSRESSSQWRSAPRPTDWTARIAYVRDRDKTCRWDEGGIACGSSDRLEVHHAGAPDDHALTSLVLLCHRHHAWITGQQIAASRERNRKRRDRSPEKHPGLL